MSDLNASLAYSLHALSDDEIKAEDIRELVIDVAMDNERGPHTLNEVLLNLLRALDALREIERCDRDEDEELSVDEKKMKQYPDEPVLYFFERYKQLAKLNNHAITDEDLDWPEHWPDRLWTEYELDYLALLTVGKDINTRAAVLEYVKKNHPEMLNNAKE